MRVSAIDCNYVYEEFAASYFLQKNGRGLFVECNTNYAIPFLEKAVQKAGMRASDIEGLVVTHVHLDHAGGAGLFLQTFPHAKLFAHPRAVPHLVNPTKLVASATSVYGAEKMAKLYGTILPCDPDRVIATEDLSRVTFQGGELTVKHARGHANHHILLIEPETKTLFSGDSFGVAYRGLESAGKLVILASTSPTDFDGPEALATIEWIKRQDLDQIALTHFGFIPREFVSDAADELARQIRFSVELCNLVCEKDLGEAEVQERLVKHFLSSSQAQGITMSDLRKLDLDFKINAQGLVYAGQKVRAKKLGF